MFRRQMIGPAFTPGLRAAQQRLLSPISWGFSYPNAKAPMNGLKHSSWCSRTRRERRA
jgi:hypothetical protein